MVWVAGTRQHDMHAWLIAAESVGGIGDGCGAPVQQKGQRIRQIKFPRVDFTAVDQLSKGLAQAGTPFHRVLVEAMVPDPRLELFAGIAFEQRFGHALLFGRGGREVESRGDTSLALLPLGAAALERIARSRGLTDAVARKVRKALEALVSFADANPERLVSLDVNPLIVTGSGDVVAVDALIESAD